MVAFGKPKIRFQLTALPVLHSAPIVVVKSHLKLSLNIFFPASSIDIPFAVILLEQPERQSLYKHCSGERSHNDPPPQPHDLPHLLSLPSLCMTEFTGHQLQLVFLYCSESHESANAGFGKGPSPYITSYRSAHQHFPLSTRGYSTRVNFRFTVRTA